MCTSIISNRNKTIVGWNLDILEMCLRLYPDKEAKSGGLCYAYVMGTYRWVFCL